MIVRKSRLNMFKLIIFDLDGTLADTSAGIYGAYHYACEQLHIPLTDESLGGVIGSNLLQVFINRFSLDEEQARSAVDVYRKWYEQNGIYQATIYPGIQKVLNKLSETHVLCVATLKREDFAQKMLAMFGITNCFQMICGMDKNDSFSKAQIIERCLKKFNIDREEAVFVGDSMSDLNGARDNKIVFMPVTYGFGFDKKTTFKDQQILGPVNSTVEILNYIN